MQHPEHHEDQLREIVIAGVKADSSEARVLLAGCRVCHERYHELLQLQEQLDSTAEMEKGILADARHLDSSPGDEIAEADRIRRVAEARANQAGRAWTWRLLRAAIAASLVIGIVYVAQRAGETTDHGPTTIGPANPAELAPVGETDDFRGPFVWDLMVGEGGYFTVDVYSNSESATHNPLTTSGRLRQASWTPSAEEVNGWPDSILWEVQAFDASGNPLDSAQAVAERKAR